MLLVYALLSLTLAAAQTSDSDNSKKDQSWTATSDSQDSSLGSRTRKTESHSKNGNRTVDRQSVEILRSGSYEPLQDIEKESVQVNATTSRTVVRIFGRNSNGQRVLLQMTEEEKQTSPDGSARWCVPPRIQTLTAAFNLCSAKCRIPGRPAPPLRKPPLPS